MRSRRTAHDEMAAITRRRLELLSAELAGIRQSPPCEEQPGTGTSPDAAGPVEQLTGRPTSAAPPGPESPAVTAPNRPVLTVVAEGPGAHEGPLPQAAEDLAPPLRGRHARRPVGAGDRVGGWLQDRLPPTLQGRVALTASHLSVVALLVAAAFAVSAWWVVRADASGAVVPAATWSDADGAPAVEQLVTPAAEPGTDPEHDTAMVADSEPAVVVVDVAGKVRRPGIVTLPLGSRVHDALEAAGGPRRGVDLTSLNLARVLVDGEQLLVGVDPPGGVAAPAASAPGASDGGASGPMVNVNTANQAELEELPGIGPVTAGSILQWRADNGPFTSVDELLEVSGIGDATLAKIAPFVTL
jgi:competence protein ComEA